MEKKEMEYTGKIGTKELLYRGNYEGYNYYILNLGTHPTAYVEIPKNHKYFGVPYYDIEDTIYTHGGLTFSSDNLILDNTTRLVNSWFIGWDYAHAGDYVKFMFPNGTKMPCNENDTKYTTDDIIIDCGIVIAQLVKIEKEQNCE